VSAPIAIQLTVADGQTVRAAFWGNGPRPGTYWYTIKVLDRNRLVLVRKLREKWIPASE
jgi:hypothetical protein